MLRLTACHGQLSLWGMPRCDYCQQPAFHVERIGQAVFRCCDNPECEARFDDNVVDADAEWQEDHPGDLED